jgi:hypothetical protein
MQVADFFRDIYFVNEQLSVVVVVVNTPLVEVLVFVSEMFWHYLVALSA